MAEASTPRDKEPIAREALRLEESCMWSAQNQFEQAKLWRRGNVLVSVPASVLAAVAGATGLAVATSRVLAAFIALAAGAFAAASSTLNLGRRVEQANAAANSYLALQTDFRIFREIDLPEASFDDARQSLSELVARQQEVNAAAPIPSRLAYDKARKNIEAGGQSHRVDAATIGRKSARRRPS